MKKVNQLFFGSSSLISLDLSMLSFSNSEDMTSKFNGMENIVSIIFDNFDSINVESMHYMFNVCWKLKDIDFTKINTSKVKK